nr:hypothetical protein Iba_chr13bCG7200 [Ipomoea batatas]
METTKGLTSPIPPVTASPELPPAILLPLQSEKVQEQALKEWRAAVVEGEAAGVAAAFDEERGRVLCGCDLGLASGYFTRLKDKEGEKPVYVRPEGFVRKAQVGREAWEKELVTMRWIRGLEPRPKGARSGKRGVLGFEGVGERRCGRRSSRSGGDLFDEERGRVLCGLRFRVGEWLLHEIERQRG